jgi:hypothetical protein
MQTELLNKLVDAVTASGKKLKDIDKNAIFAFLDKEGAPKNTWSTIYDRLESVFNGSFNGSSSGFNGNPKKEDRTHKSSIVDYSDSSHNDVKVRQPRKTVFSEMKKIAG